MDELIKRLKSNPDFLEFTDHILEVIETLDTISGLDALSNEQAGEEAKVRSKTKEKLYEILRPFIEFKDKREPTAEEVNNAKARFGL